MGTGNGGVKIPCWRHIYAGGAYVWLDDTESPSLNPPTGAPASGWINNDTQIKLGVSASDNGLGVQNVFLKNSSGGNAPLVGQNVCTGLKQSQCPTNMNGQITVTPALFKEGERPASLIAEDPTGKLSSKYEWQMKVDNTAPLIDLGGQLAEATEEDEGAEEGGEEVETLSLPVYNLQIEAADGSAGKPEDKRSGVKSIAVFLDGKGTPEAEWTQTCAASSCSMSKTFTLRLPDLAAGNHTLNVVSKDQLNQSRTRPIEFSYVPATGMKDDYVMHYFPLPDGLGNEEEEEFPARPELAVNVINGNLVYRERDVDVEGYAVDLELERYYNSQLPSAQSTEWGEGWTLAQTPELEPEEGQGPPEEAELLDTSGALDAEVELPTETGAEEFDPELQATLTKEAGGYELSDETGETSTDIAFDESGRTEELRTEGYAKVDYDYQAGALSEIAVKDPGSLAPIEGVEEPSPIEPPSYQSSFGSQGSGNGQLKAPADIALDSLGNLWVADRENNRIQKFDPQGNYLAQFGTQGEGNGQLSSPSALAIDASGHIWVADTANHRIQEFSATGEYLGKFGVAGLGEGQLLAPEAVAIGPDGTLWISDGLFGAFRRVQRFAPNGTFIERVGSYGTGSGQLVAPKGIDVDREGNAWVADAENNRVSVFDEDGDFLFQFGSQGTGDGQFKAPAEVEVGEGSVWVGEAEGDRLQRFDLEGNFLAKFGSAGSALEQFNLASPMGIASDGMGRVWITDVGNNRVQEWLVVPDRDPSVEVEVEAGLVQSLAGEAAGEHTYEHEGELLTSHEGPQGETLYEYDEEGRLTRVELANGTWAEISYDSTSRVETVEVDPAGEDPATSASFSYDDVNRRTTVVGSQTPTVRYEYTEEGAVFKWQNVSQPPSIDNLAGSFYAFRETETPISVGDHNLSVTGHSFEGVKSIELIVNGSELVDEKICEEDPQTPEVECQSVELGWTAYTGSLEPGKLDLEVLVTDHLGQEASERFWVKIPRPLPDVPGGVEEPHFAEVLEFREEYGLDLDLKGDEEAIEDRVFMLLYLWGTGDPVARSSMERWGVPLFSKDVAELEYRERYLAHDGPLIAEWGESELPSTYAGYYLDHPAGGKIRVGLTDDSESHLEALKSSIDLMAADRVAPFEPPPLRSLAYLRSTWDNFDQQIASDASASSVLTTSSLDIKANRIRLDSTNPSLLEDFILHVYGSVNDFVVIHVPINHVPRNYCFEEYDNPYVRPLNRRLYAGDFYSTITAHCGCTLAFGAWEKTPKTRPNGIPVKLNYALTAGHCYNEGDKLKRIGYSLVNGQKVEKLTGVFGTLARNSLLQEHSGFRTDASAVRLNGTTTVPRQIYTSRGKAVINGESPWFPGKTLCAWGPVGRPDTRGFPVCRPTAPNLVKNHEKEWVPMWQIRLPVYGRIGDSGGPVWSPATGSAVGLITGGPPVGSPTEVTPLLSLEGKPYAKYVDPGTAPGALNVGRMANPRRLRIVDGVK